jgi:hypothetical protein
VDFVNDAVAVLKAAAPVLAILVPTLALAVSVTALGVSISSRNTAKESLGVAQRGELRTLPDVGIHLVQARQKANSGKRSIVLSVEITNRSHSAIWIRRASLWIEYLLETQNMLSEVALSESPSAPVLAFPLELKARQVSAGSLEFDVSDQRTAGRPVIRQSLRLTDTDGREWTLDNITAGS